MSQKKENTNLSEVFTIDLDGSDSFDIPGVTQLLNPAKMAQVAKEKEEREAKAKKAASASASAIAPLLTPPPAAPVDGSFSLEPTRTISAQQFQESMASKLAATPAPVAATTEAPERLKDIAILFEFQFKSEGSFFRFKTGVPHKESFLQAWQHEVLADMKLDLKNISFKGPFQEFRYETFGYLFAAFGIQPQHFIQIAQSSNTVHVLISSQSQAAHRDAIMAIVQQTPAEKTAILEKGSGVIELDLTG